MTLPERRRHLIWSSVIVPLTVLTFIEPLTFAFVICTSPEMAVADETLPASVMRMPPLTTSTDTSPVMPLTVALPEMLRTVRRVPGRRRHRVVDADAVGRAILVRVGRVDRRAIAARVHLDLDAIQAQLGVRVRAALREAHDLDRRVAARAGRRP